MWDVQLFELNYDHQEHAAVTEVLESRWLTMGDSVRSFEKQFGAFLGEGVGCVSVSSGTAALHLAVLAAGVAEGDEVIIPALTFVADANVVALSGGSPVLADIDSLDNWNLSLDTIRAKVTEKTKAVIVVHFAGYPCEDIVEIAEFCAEEGLVLIEDVAHAPGAEVRGQKCGTFGDFGCFSFFSNKNLSIGEGGMISTRCDNLYRIANELRSHGMSSLTLDRHKGRALTYDVSSPGLNYRLDEIRGALGLVQLGKLEAGNIEREKLTQKYRRMLDGTTIKIPFSNESQACSSAYHIMPVMLPCAESREHVMMAMKSEGIQTSIHYPPFWGFRAFGKVFTSHSAPRAAEVCARELTLPLHPNLKPNQVEKVVAALLEAVS